MQFRNSKVILIAMVEFLPRFLLVYVLSNVERSEHNILLDVYQLCIHSMTSVRCSFPLFYVNKLKWDNRKWKRQIDGSVCRSVHCMDLDTAQISSGHFEYEWPVRLCIFGVCAICNILQCASNIKSAHTTTAKHFKVNKMPKFVFK